LEGRLERGEAFGGGLRAGEFLAVECDAAVVVAHGHEALVEVTAFDRGIRAGAAFSGPAHRHGPGGGLAAWRKGRADRPGGCGGRGGGRGGCWGGGGRGGGGCGCGRGGDHPGRWGGWASTSLGCPPRRRDRPCGP